MKDTNQIKSMVDSRIKYLSGEVVRRRNTGEPLHSFFLEMARMKEVRGYIVQLEKENRALRKKLKRIGEIL